MSELQSDISNITRHFSNALHHNPLAVQRALVQCREEDGSYNMLKLVDCVLRLPAVRGSLEGISCHVQHIDDVSSVVPEEPIGAKMVNSMLSKEKYFLEFRCSYYLLYQSFKPTSLHIILKRYTLPESFGAHRLKPLKWRAANQSLLNFLLIELRRDKDLTKFWETLRMMIEEPHLKNLVNNYALPKRSMNEQHRIASSVVCDKTFTCLSETALPATPFVAATGDPVQMYLFLKTKRCRRPVFHRSTSEEIRRCWQPALNRSVSEGVKDRHVASHLLELWKNDKGSPMDQQKLKMHAEIDRLVDEKCLSYNETVDICLKIVGTEKKLFNTSAGGPLVESDPHLTESLPHHTESLHVEEPFRAEYADLPKLKPKMFAVLMKYNNVLLDNFPENYMTSFEAVCQIYPIAIPSSTIEYVTAPTSYRAVNQRILHLIITMMLKESREHFVMKIVAVVEGITGDFDKNIILKQFDDELMDAIAQEVTSNRKLPNGNAPDSSKVDHSEFEVPSDSHKPPVSTSYSHQWVDNALYQSVPAAPVSQIDETSDIIFSEPNNLDKLKPKTLAVIKKYYNVLLKGFPEDHMISLERYLSIKKLSDAIVDYIASAGSPYQANRRLFGYMTYVISPDHEDSFFNFCNYLEMVIANPEMEAVIEQLRNDLIEAIFEDVSNSNRPMSHDTPHLQPEHSLLSLHYSLPSQQHSLTSPQSLSPHQSSSPYHSLVPQQPLSPQQSFGDIQQAPVFDGDPNDPYYIMCYELIASMPEDFKKTVGDLREHFSDAEANEILSSPDYLTGNRRILITLLSHLKHGEEIFQLWNILLSIKDAPHLPAVVESVKRKVFNSMYSRWYADAPGAMSDHTSSLHYSQELDQYESVSDSQAELKRKEFIALVNKHYSSLLKCFPEDFSIQRGTMYTHGGQLSKFSISDNINSQIYNEIIFNDLINQLVSPDHKMTPVDFCGMLLMMTGDPPAVKELQKDVLKLLDNKTAARARMSFGFALNHWKSSKRANWKVRDDEGVKKEQEICLSSFDEYYDLLLKVNPRFAKDKFFFSFKFEHGDPITGNLLFQHNEIQMEVLLAHVRNSIVTYGTTCFLKLIDILCDQEPYKEIGFHMLDAYHAKGGRHIPSGCYTRTGNPLPIEELTRRLEYHSRQLLAGIQYQPPKPLPPYYVPRPDLLSKMIQAIMDSDTGSIDVDLALFSLRGCGKCTLVKALCFDDDMMRHFLDGFLWIKFGIGTINHYSKLTKIYQQLTAMTFTGDQSLLVDKLKTLASNHLRRLLVILHDVYTPEDVMLYLEIFRSCKVILVSTKEELCSLIAVKQKLVLGLESNMSMSLELLTMRVKGFENMNDQLLAQLKALAETLLYWPFLLGIVHHHLLLYCNKYQLSPADALQRILQKLISSKRSKNYGMDCTEVIIESSLEFLENKDICCLNELLYSGGFDHVTPKCFLPHVWKVSEEVANQCIELLHSCGLVQYTEKLQLTETTYSVIPCVEVHSLIVQHFLLKMNNTPSTSYI